MLKLGICMPDACTADETQKIVNKGNHIKVTLFYLMKN